MPVKLSSPARSEHQFFSVAAIAVTVIVLAGFVPIYSLRLLHHDPNLILLVHIHGFVMAAWIALFLAQTLLIARHRAGLHRRLGVLGAGLASLVILAGVPTLIHAAARHSHGVYDTQFLWMLAAFDGLALVVFAGLVCGGMLLRRRSDSHKRLMLLATLSLLGPAFGRLTSLAMGLRGDSDLGVLLLGAGIVLVSIFVDRQRTGRLHPAFVWGGAAVIGMYVATYIAKLML